MSFLRGILLGGWALASFCLPGAAQSILNVTNYGAKGDAVQFYVNTVSNSVIVTTTNIFSSTDIGKTIQVWGVGQKRIGVNSYGMNVTNYIDAIGTITNVVGGTNLYVSFRPQATRTGTFATCGTDNTATFNQCIAAAPADAIIDIPAGTYLCIPTNRNYAGNGYLYGSILVNRGGLHFRGQGTNTVLLSKGAFVWSDVYPYGTNGVRGFLFECVAPIANNSRPIILDSFVLDGGVPQGNLDVHGITVNTVDGLGWDEQHSAWLCCDLGNNTGTANRQIFTNIVVQHWRGEMFKSIDGNKNGNIIIYDSAFRDGCATALNIY